MTFLVCYQSILHLNLIPGEYWIGKLACYTFFTYTKFCIYVYVHFFVISINRYDLSKFHPILHMGEIQIKFINLKEKINFVCKNLIVYLVSAYAHAPTLFSLLCVKKTDGLTLHYYIIFLITVLLIIGNYHGIYSFPMNWSAYIQYQYLYDHKPWQMMKVQICQCVRSVIHAAPNIWTVIFNFTGIIPWGKCPCPSMMQL